MYTEDQIQQANSADIMSLVQSHGMTYNKVGHEFHIRGYGGLYVNPDKNIFSCFSRYSADGKVLGGKGALSFACKILGYDFKSAMREIVGSDYNYKPFVPRREYSHVTEEKKEFIMPPRSENIKQTIAYLTKTRKLAPALVNEFIKKGLLFQTFSEKDGKRHENGVFVHFNNEGKPCGAEIFGISSFGRFKKNVLPDETDKGFVYQKGNDPKTVYLFEAAIDLMSFVQMHPEIDNAKFVSMSGLKPTIAAHYLNDPTVRVVSCVDNDARAQAFNRSVCMNKISDSLGGDNIQRHVSSGDPPIDYCSADRDGRKCFYFASSDDYRSAVVSDRDILKGGACFIWKNTSSFEINYECKEAGVKDFNELLVLRADEAEAKNRFAHYADRIKQFTYNNNNMIPERAV